MSQRGWVGLLIAAVVAVAPSCRNESQSTHDSAQATAAASAATVAVPSSSAPTAAPTPPPTALTTTPPAPSAPLTTTTAPSAPPSTDATAPSAPPSTDATGGRPEWLGQRPLPLRPDGYGEVQPTPSELVDRRLPTLDVLAPPAGDIYESVISALPADVLARSTWHPGCPVDASDLRYVTLSFWGFDDRPHTGELLVNVDVADSVVDVFGALFDARFPIEEMRIVRAGELDTAPTGDGNNTSAFVCRNAVLSENWSQHAYGRAIDVNPFHNPYVRGGLVLPELASAYADRTNIRPGMVLPGDVVVHAFASIGWEWGGDFNTFRDDMHFSATGH